MARAAGGWAAGDDERAEPLYSEMCRALGRADRNAATVFRRTGRPSAITLTAANKLVTAMLSRLVRIESEVGVALAAVPLPGDAELRVLQARVEHARGGMLAIGRAAAEVARLARAAQTCTMGDAPTKLEIVGAEAMRRAMSEDPADTLQ